MGIPSVGILLHEVIKLMYHAKVKDPIFFRIGTCGGIGLEGGTVVISEEAVDGMLKSYLELVRNFSEKNSLLLILILVATYFLEKNFILRKSRFLTLYISIMAIYYIYYIIYYNTLHVL